MLSLSPYLEGWFEGGFQEMQMFGAKGNRLQLTIRSVLHYKCFNNNHLPRHIFIIQCSLIIIGSFAQNLCLALSLDKPESLMNQG